MDTIVTQGIIYEDFYAKISDSILTQLRDLGDTFENSRSDFELPEEAFPIYKEIVKTFNINGWKKFKVVRVKSWNYCGRWYYNVYKDQNHYFEIERINNRYYH